MEIAIMLAVSIASFAEGSDVGSHIKSITAITEVYGDGQKISAVAVEYDSAIDNSRLKKTDFAIEGKVVSKVYAASAAAKAPRGADGAFVIVEVDNRIQPEAPMTPAGPGADGGGEPLPGTGGPKLGEQAKPFAGVAPLSARVTQKGKLTTVTGKTLAAWAAPLVSAKTIDLVVQDFKQLVYMDNARGNQSLMYNLFVPANYDPAKKYPLVLFMHDAGAVSNNPIETLTQGLGAIAWATPESQAKNACFVLAPQYSSIIADDSSSTTEPMDITVDLVKDLLKRYSIDPARLYNTGQSMGGMAAIAMDIKYPELFAASLLVACQWDPAKVSPLARKPLWIIVSEGDSKAKPGMDAIVGVLKGLGATVVKDAWSAEAGQEELDKEASSMLAAKASIEYVVFNGGSHRYTWQYAYGIDAVREWLFNQRR
jgi:predicted peptidase